MNKKIYFYLPFFASLILFGGCATVNTTKKWASVDKDYGADKCVRLNLYNIPETAYKRLSGTVSCIDQCCWVYEGETTEVTLNFNRGSELDLESRGVTELYTPEKVTVYLSNIMRTGVINTTAEPPVIDEYGNVMLEARTVVGKPRQVKAKPKITTSKTKTTPATQNRGTIKPHAVDAEYDAPYNMVRKEVEPRLLKAINRLGSQVQTKWRFSINPDGGYNASCVYNDAKNGKNNLTCGDWIVDDMGVYPNDDVAKKVFRQP